MELYRDYMELYGIIRDYMVINYMELDGIR